jgi:hypothetical protein
MAATAIVAGIQTRYQQTMALVSAQPFAAAPVVAWISVYAGTFTISTAPYKRSFTQDAGGALFAPTVLSFTDVNAFHQGETSVTAPLQPALPREISHFAALLRSALLRVCSVTVPRRRRAVLFVRSPLSAAIRADSGCG